MPDVPQRGLEMPLVVLGEPIAFPPVELAEDGLVAVGGDLAPARLVRAYSEGIFPWYSEDEPILWYSPDPRFVLTTATFRVPRSLRRVVAARPFELALDTDFRAVIEACATIPRVHERGTWITSEMQEAYTELHRRGLAHSVEARLDGRLVGGLYGVSLGGAFFGESMFARVSEASKVAFVALVRQLAGWGIDLIDCQVSSEHLARFGARSWSRSRYLAALRRALQKPTRRGVWRFDEVASATAAGREIERGG
jgi:leucyl/phenylalanyl-tRNA--protein transferase